jgi:hypothetical protein
MRARTFAAGAAVTLLLGCEPGTAPPPPLPLPPLPVITPVSQCKQVFPSGYTRPVPTDHDIIILTALPGVRRILWLDRHCDHYVIGPYDPTHPYTACKYRPQDGDRYYSEDDSFVAEPPQGCPYP